jgi:glycerophosphoryl diester phosphodiesterase
LAGFELALKLGATGLESDVWLTADGIPVLDHDGVVRKALGKSRPIGDLPRSALPNHIPSLADLIERCGSDYHLSLDLKDAACGHVVITTIAAAAPAMLERLWLCAASWDSLLPLRGRGAKLVDSTRLSRIKEGPERRAADMRNHGIDALNMHHSDWTGGTVALFHRFDRVAFGWDMQQPHILQAGFRMGLDGIYSDWVDRMIEAYKAEVGLPR